jgi:threonine/homoserine/homoserine lactone efflux protein
MIDVHTISSVSLICLAGAMSPGPSFVAVSHRAVVGRREEALAFAFGISLVNAIWAFISIIGLSVILIKMPTLFNVFKIAGAAYLIWFGISLIRKSNREIKDIEVKNKPSSILSALRDGLMNNIANPKSMAFYASVFSAVLPADASLATSVAMVFTAAGVSWFWYGGVAMLLSTKVIASAYKKIKHYIDRFCGAILVFFGVRLAIT